MSSVGLYIPPELLAAGLTPAEILIAAEILQFGEGKCYASSQHFSARLSMPRRTVFRALKTMKESGVLTYEKGVKVIHIAVGGSAKVATISAEMAYDKTALNSADMAYKSATMATPVPKWHHNKEVNIEDKKEINKKRDAQNTPEHPPEILSLAETMARIRREVSGVAKITRQPAEYYAALFSRMVNGEATLESLSTVVNWLDKTQDGRKAFGYGMANLPKKHGHSFERLFASNLALARSSSPKIAQTAGQQAAWPGTAADFWNPEFNPGEGWRLTDVTQKLQNTITGDIEDVPAKRWVRA